MAKKQKNVTENLPQVEVTDSTTTKGVKTKPTINESVEELKKTKVFQSLRAKLVKSFDLNTTIANCIAKGITDFQTEIENQKQLVKTENSRLYTFTEFVELLKTQSEYKDLLNVLCVTDLFDESHYTHKGSAKIYHSNQNENKDYQTEKITIGKNEIVIYWECVENTIENWLRSIRYYSVKTNAVQTAINKEVKTIKTQIDYLIGKSIIEKGSKKTLQLIESVLN